MKREQSRKTIMPVNSCPLTDLPRVALAIEAITFGMPHPVLIHAEHSRTSGTSPGPFGLLFTPLCELETLAQATAVLSRVSPGSEWLLAGLCAPTSVRLTEPPATGPERLTAWIIRVMTSDGDCVTRLGVPDAPELSGPSTGVSRNHDVDHCLAHLLGIDVGPGGQTSKRR